MKYSTDAIKPIELPRPSQMVAAELRQRILRGEWNEDMPLPPAPVLAERLGISCHHLREALRLLEHDGLIRVERGRNGGVTLDVPDEAAVTRTLEGILARYDTPVGEMDVARAEIDTVVAHLAASEATIEDIEILEEIIEKEAAGAWWQVPCTAFHMKLAGATHNRPLLVMARAAWPIGLSARTPILNELEMRREEPSVLAQAIEAHRGLVEALRSRDGQRASALMREHHAQLCAHIGPEVQALRIGTDRED